MLCTKCGTQVVDGAQFYYLRKFERFSSGRGFASCNWPVLFRAADLDRPCGGAAMPTFPRARRTKSLRTTPARSSRATFYRLAAHNPRGSDRLTPSVTRFMPAERPRGSLVGRRIRCPPEIALVVHPLPKAVKPGRWNVTAVAYST